MKFLKHFHIFEITLITVVMAVHIYAAFSAPHNFPSKWFTRDDAYYYFKVAQNISEGRGSTFDGINLTNGYHPLWLLVCVPIFSLARFDLILPLRILMLVMAALSATTSVLLFRLLKKQTGLPIAMLAASFWAFSLDVHSVVTQQGMESGIVALSMVVFLILLQKAENSSTIKPRTLIGLGFAALFVIFSRLDGIYLVLVGGIWVVFRRSPIRYLLPIDLLITLSIIVWAYIQRTSLPIYLLGSDNSAILMAAITVMIQTIIFYFIGLYIRPASLPVLRIIIMTAAGVTLSAFVSAIVLFLFSQIGLIVLPRAVPLIYWVGMLILTLVTRLGIRFISPWPPVLSKDMKPALGVMAGKYQFRLALEPISKWLHDATFYFGIAGAGLLVYFGVNQKFFGTLMPVSGQIKRWWGSMPNNVYGGGAKSVLDVFGLDPNFSESWQLVSSPINDLAKTISAHRGFDTVIYWLLFTLALAAWLLVFLMNRRKNLRRAFLVGIIPLLISAELHVFFYGAMAYASTHEWYWVMQMLALVIMAALGLRAALDYLPRTKPFQFITWGLTGLTSLYLAYGFAFELVNRMPYQDALTGKPYIDTLPIFEGYTQPGALIGMTGGGTAAYFIKDRTIINMDGLINSYAYFTALKNNQGGKFLAGIGLKYIFANRYIISNSMPYSSQFFNDELVTVDGAPLYGQKELMRYIPRK